MGKVKFDPSDFKKIEDVEILSAGDVEKQDLETIRVDLEWKGTDLDVCAFMLDKDGSLTVKDDLVCFRSQCRWKPKKAFNDPEFDPLDGAPSKWNQEQVAYKGKVKKWQKATLPASLDYSVIGSWDDMTEDPDAPCGETMHVLIEEVDTTKYKRIVLAAVVAEKQREKGETFKDVADAKVTITDVDSEELLVEYALASRFPDKDAVCFGELIYDDANYLWRFKPMADAYKGGILYLANEVFQ